MSDLLEAAAAALGTPPELVLRSATARADQSGASIDDILAAWSGGAPAPAAVSTVEPETAPTEATPELEVGEPTAAAAVMETPPTPAPAETVIEAAPEEPLEPVSIGERVRTAARVGAWTGAASGLAAFLMASAFWAPSAQVLEDTGPVVNVESFNVLTGVAIVSIAFGAIAASFSRAAAAWRNPAMQLQDSKSSTAWIGAGLGLALGILAGALLLSVGASIEGAEGNVVQLPVLSTFAVMLIGGAVLGAATAATPQMFGTPVALNEEDRDQIETVKDRLGAAVVIPLAATLLLAALVVPFGYLLIQSNHMSGNGAGIVAILTSAGILGFAAMSGSKPNMRITFGDMMWAFLAIAVVLVIVVSVMFYVDSNDPGEHDAGGHIEKPLVRPI